MFTTGLEPLFVKLALRAGFRAMQRAGAGGNVTGLADLWRGRDAWMKPTTKLDTTMSLKERMQGGRTLSGLGAGSEGVADAVLHPQHGLAVRKAYNPTGMATPETIARKEQMGRAAGGDSAVARFFGSQPTPQGRSTMHFSELVGGTGPHRAPVEGSPRHWQEMERAFKGTQQAAGKGGFEAHDVRLDNMKWDPRKGQYRTVDALPARPGEFLPRNARGHTHMDGGWDTTTPENMLMGDPKAPWMQAAMAKPMQPVAPTSPMDPWAPGRAQPTEQALRQQLLGIHRMPGERMPRAQRQAPGLASQVEPQIQPRSQLFRQNDIDQALSAFGR